MLVDFDRLAVYRQLLALPVDPLIADMIGHHRTAHAPPHAHRITELHHTFIRYLMYRELDHKGEL